MSNLEDLCLEHQKKHLDEANVGSTTYDIRHLLKKNKLSENTKSKSESLANGLFNRGFRELKERKMTEDALINEIHSSRINGMSYKKQIRLVEDSARKNLISAYVYRVPKLKSRHTSFAMMCPNSSNSFSVIMLNFSKSSFSVSVLPITVGSHALKRVLFRSDVWDLRLAADEIMEYIMDTITICRGLTQFNDFDTTIASKTRNGFCLVRNYEGSGCHITSWCKDAQKKPNQVVVTSLYETLETMARKYSIGVEEYAIKIGIRSCLVDDYFRHREAINAIESICKLLREESDPEYDGLLGNDKMLPIYPAQYKKGNL